MAMNHSNYGYSPSAYLSPYSSTPTGIRTHRPRFAYSGPALYPRPRSSASKPNPDSFSDSMINNYGTSTSQIDTSFSENGSSYNDGYDSSNYFTANESFYSQNQSYGDSSIIRNSPMRFEDPKMVYNNSPIMMRGERSLACGESPGILPKPNAQFTSPKYPFNSTVGVINKGNFPKNSTSRFDDKNNKPPFIRKNNNTKGMNTKQSAWRCDLCSLDFTSQIPYDMHLRGARHAKKLKAKQALSSIELQDFKSQDGEKSFFCEMCNVRANSSVQLQTHLEGSKHKNKLQPKEPKDASQDSSKETIKTDTDTPLNGKANGSLIRSLPADFGEPQPSKLTKYACDVCNITVNSEIQLQQHLSSKKHNNKVEGKSTFRVRKVKEVRKEIKTTETGVSEVVANTESEPASTEIAAKIVGVKTLSSSFVQGETLH